MMKKILSILMLMLFVSLFNSCNEESFIEDFSSSDGSSNGQNNTPKGSVVFWTNNGNLFFCSDGFNVYVDGNYVGTITTLRQSSANCGPSTSDAVSLQLTEGTHSVMVKGTGTYCPTYNFTFQIEKNTCLSYQLQ